MQICPRARFALSNWLFVVQRLTVYCGMLRFVAAKMTQQCNASGVNGA